jgi:heme exporter protein A
VTALRAEGLTVKYAGQPSGAPALSDINLDVQAGERLLLVGPNGAGKSTFIRVFAGLMRASRGHALVAGVPAREARAQVGVVSHTTYLYEELTALENVRLYAQLYGVDDAAERAVSLLEELGAGRLRDVQVGRLSRGQQQRVTIARALVHDPPVLLLDEPDTGLDVAAFDLMVELTTASRRTIVLTTHNLMSGLRLATRLGVLSRGQLVREQPDARASDAPALSELLEHLARQ